MRDPDKPQQIIEAAVRVFARKGYYNSRVSDIAGEADAASKIRRLVSLHFRILEESPDLAEVVQVELRQGQKLFRGASSQEIGAYFALIGSVLEEGVAEGRFRADLPVKVATKILFGAMDQMATSWVLGKRGYQLVDTADAVAEIFLQGVAAPTS